MKEEKTKLNNSQLKVMQLLWEDEPATAKELTLRAAERYGWNKNTTYTVLKTLVEKGAVTRTDPDFVCASAVSLEQVRRVETRGLIEKLYQGSCTAFFSTFLEEEKLDSEQLEELRRLIESKK